MREATGPVVLPLRLAELQIFQLLYFGNLHQSLTEYFAGLWLMLGWWVLIGVAVAVWATVDYVKKGGTGDVVDRFKYPV